MSSKRAIRRRQCDGKVRHVDAETAAQHIKQLHATRGYQGQMNIYRCQFCGGYHVGHRGNRGRV